MNAASGSPMHIVTFGDLELGVWGAAVGNGTCLVVCDGRARHGQLAAHDAGDWRLSADGVELTVAAAGPMVKLPGEEDFDQLCQVHGSLGVQRPIDCLGRRATRTAALGKEFESIRDVSAWFAPDEGVALTALRRRKTRGHEQDAVSGAVLDVTAAAPVADPRLSTTYNGQGLPTRMGLELWLDSEEEEQQYPRRAAGQAEAAPAVAEDAERELVAQLLRCQSRGNQGTGVYLLLRGR
jgi:hypothetical protein